MQNSCQLTTQLTGSQAGGHFTPTSQSSSHRLTFNWTLSFTNQLLHVTSLNWTPHDSLLTTNSLLQTVLLIISQDEPHRKHCFHCYSPTICRPLHRNGCLFILPLHSNGCTSCPFWGLCPAMGLYATTFIANELLKAPSLVLRFHLQLVFTKPYSTIILLAHGSWTSVIFHILHKSIFVVTMAGWCIGMLMDVDGLKFSFRMKVWVAM
jgi:hypothetical protein